MGYKHKLTLALKSFLSTGMTLLQNYIHLVDFSEVGIIPISKFQPGTVERNSSTTGPPPAGIEPTPVRFLCTARQSTELRR